MAKERLVVNGYIVPGGFSGVAVRRACETVLANPGIPQTQLLQEAVRYSGINMGTASWITSPGPRSPATLLWDRRKEGTFKCYPNEHTEKVIGAGDVLFDETMDGVRLQLRGVKYRPTPGELVSFAHTNGEVYSTGMFIGYHFGEHLGVGPAFSSIEDITAARPGCKIGDRVHAVIIENGTGRRMMNWMLGCVRPA